MDASERSVRTTYILDVAGGRADYPNLRQSLRRGDVQLLHDDQNAFGERLRDVDGRPRYDQHNIVHLPLHWLLLPMGVADGGRGRKEYWHSIRYIILHSRPADGSDESRSREAPGTTVPKFLPVVHGDPTLCT